MNLLNSLAIIGIIVFALFFVKPSYASSYDTYTVESINYTNDAGYLILSNDYGRQNGYNDVQRMVVMTCEDSVTGYQLDEDYYPAVGTVITHTSTVELYNGDLPYHTAQFAGTYSTMQECDFVDISDTLDTYTLVYTLPSVEEDTLPINVTDTLVANGGTYANGMWTVVATPRTMAYISMNVGVEVQMHQALHNKVYAPMAMVQW